jgi:hypothetical protein
MDRTQLTSSVSYTIERTRESHALNGNEKAQTGVQKKKKKKDEPARKKKQDQVATGITRPKSKKQRDPQNIFLMSSLSLRIGFRLCDQNYCSKHGAFVLPLFREWEECIKAAL